MVYATNAIPVTILRIEDHKGLVNEAPGLYRVFPRTILSTASRISTLWAVATAFFVFENAATIRALTGRGGCIHRSLYTGELLSGIAPMEIALQGYGDPIWA